MSKKLVAYSVATTTYHRVFIPCDPDSLLSSKIEQLIKRFTFDLDGYGFTIYQIDNESLDRLREQLEELDDEL